MTVKPGHMSPISTPIRGNAHALILVADLLCQVLFVLPLPPDISIPAVQPRAWCDRCWGRCGSLGVVAHLLVTHAQRPVVALVVPAVLPCLIASCVVVGPVIVLEVITPCQVEPLVTINIHTGGFFWSTYCHLPLLWGGAVVLHPVPAVHGGVGRGHWDGGGCRGIFFQLEVIAEIIFAETDSVVVTVSKHAVSPNLAPCKVVSPLLVVGTPAASEHHMSMLCVSGFNAEIFIFGTLNIRLTLRSCMRRSRRTIRVIVVSPAIET